MLFCRCVPQNAPPAFATPADCVKVALGCLMTEKPDIVFSGINAGYNVGRDILYSGTIGAAMEALCWGVPAIAFSVAEEDECEVLNTYLEPVAKELISKTLPQNEIWNVNFPGCTLEEYKGILWDRIPDQNQYYRDNYKRTDRPDGSCIFSAAGLPETEAADGGGYLNLFITLPHMSICPRIVISVTFQKVYHSPHTKASADCCNQCGQSADCTAEKCHIIL